MRPIESTNELGRLYTAHLLLPQVKSAASSEGNRRTNSDVFLPLDLFGTGCHQADGSLGCAHISSNFVCIGNNNLGMAGGKSDLDHVSTVCVVRYVGRVPGTVGSRGQMHDDMAAGPRTLDGVNLPIGLLLRT
eukprot:3287868-Prymnesium_polylepis.1